MTAPLFPSQPDDVTAEWMTVALAGTFPGIEVTQIEVLDQHSGTTGRMRVRLHYAQGPVGPDTVFVKLPPVGETQQRLVARTDMGRREARFYAGPAAEAPLRIPQSYYSAASEDPTEYVMVLEDLEASGARFTSRLEPQTEAWGRDLVESLARLHAHFWEDPRFATELSWVSPAMRGGYAAKLIRSALDQFGAELPSVFTELCNLYADNHTRICELWDEGEQTLIHGDTHAGNQYLTSEGVGLYDWAVISRSPGIRDLAIYLGNSCPTDLRRAHQEEWIERYRNVLLQAGVDAPTFDELWLRYRLGVLYAWVATTTTASMGSRWQPIEIGRMGMERATTTCADLDTVGAFRSLL